MPLPTLNLICIICTTDRFAGCWYAVRSRATGAGIRTGDDIPHDKIPYDNIPYNNIPYDDMPYDDIPYNNIPYDDILYDDVSYNKILYNDTLEYCVRHYDMTSFLFFSLLNLLPGHRVTAASEGIRYQALLQQPLYDEHRGHPEHCFLNRQVRPHAPLPLPLHLLFRGCGEAAAVPAICRHARHQQHGPPKGTHR